MRLKPCILSSFCVFFHANRRASRGCEEDGVGFDVSGTAGVKVERRVSTRPGAEGAVVESVRWVVKLVVVLG